MNYINLIRRIIDRIFITISVLLFSAGVIATVLGTITRSINFLPTLTWTSELTSFLIVVSIFLVVGIGVRRGIQISFPLFLEKLPHSLNILLSTFNNLLTIFFFVVIGYYGFHIAQSNTGQTSPILQIPMVYPYLAIPIGSALIIIELLLMIIENFLQGSKRS